MVRRVQPKEVLTTSKAAKRAKARAMESEVQPGVRTSRIANLTKEFLDSICRDYRVAKELRKGGTGKGKPGESKGTSPKKGVGNGTKVEAMPARIRYTDVAMQGLAIDVTQTGRITWRLRIKKNTGSRQTWLTLGRYPGLNPEAARLKAEKIIGEDNPTEHRRRERSPLTVQGLSDVWLKEHVDKELAPGTQHSYRQFLKYYILPTFKDRRLDELNLEALEQWHGALSKNSGKTTADGALRVFSSMLSWARLPKQGYIKTNPARDVVQNGRNKIHRPLGESGLAKVGRTIEGMLERGEENPFYLFAILLALLTGWRRASIAAIAWDDINTEGRTATLFFHKGVRKAGPIQMPLEDEVLGLLKQIPRLDDCPYLFPGRTTDRHVSPTTLSIVWRTVRERAGVKTAEIHIDEKGKRYFPDVRFHDLRHTVGSMAGNEGSTPKVAAMLGQVNPSSAERYSKPIPDDVREMKAKVEARVARGLGVPAERFSEALSMRLEWKGPPPSHQMAMLGTGDPLSVPQLDGRAVTLNGSRLEASSTTLEPSQSQGRYPGKEELQRLVVEKPVTQIARELGVSDKAVEKHCKRLGIVKPGRGYWARKRAEET